METSPIKKALKVADAWCSIEIESSFRLRPTPGFQLFRGPEGYQVFLGMPKRKGEIAFLEIVPRDGSSLAYTRDDMESAILTEIGMFRFFMTISSLEELGIELDHEGRKKLCDRMGMPEPQPRS